MFVPVLLLFGPAQVEDSVYAAICLFDESVYADVDFLRNFPVAQLNKKSQIVNINKYDNVLYNADVTVSAKLE